MSKSKHDAEARDFERRITAARTPHERSNVVKSLFATNDALREENERLRPKPDPRVPALRAEMDRILADDHPLGTIHDVRAKAWEKVGRKPTAEERKSKAFPPELGREVALRRWVGLSDDGEHCATWDEDAVVKKNRARYEQSRRDQIALCGAPVFNDSPEEVELICSFANADRLAIAGQPVGVAVPLDGAPSSGRVGGQRTLLHELAEKMGLKFD